MRVRIEADRAVRDLVDEVQVVVETQRMKGGGWSTALSQRFEPRATSHWPLEFTVNDRAAQVNYLVTATASDERSAVVVEARALRDAKDLGSRSIFMRFEGACIRRMELCPKGETCHDGDCVDAHYEAPRDAPDEPSEPADVPDAGPDPGGPTLAAEGDGCAPDGARSCTEEGSRTPLECAGGHWRPAPMCGEDELCETAPGARRGTCRQLADECRGRSANVPFCDREIMRVCVSSFTSETRPCGENAHCVASTGAHCDCMTGFIQGATGCERPSDCKVANGGCDSLVACTMSGTERMCGVCPSGYLGDGETGCEPLLAGLTPSAGELVPPFDPTVHNYHVKAGLLTQRLTLTPSAPSAERIELNGAAVESGGDWTTPTLPLGEYPVKLTLTSKSGVTSAYDVIVERSGAQLAYLKPSNTRGNDNFGTHVAMSGDTLVVGSLDEDSAATKVDGDQADDNASGAGAAYVFVQRGEQWEQQAYLKPNDTKAGDHFGFKVAIDGDTIVVGAIMEPLDWDFSRRPDRGGAAYVFTRSAGRWTQTERLASPDNVAGDRFGYGLAMRGDTLAVGAPTDGADGSVFIFTRAGAGWKHLSKLKAMPSVAGAAFGYSVALSNDTLLVGAAMDDRQIGGGGAAYVFARNGTDWLPQQRLMPDPPSSGASFGYSVALHDDRALVGAPRLQSIINALATTESGEVFAYQRSGGTWAQIQVLKNILPHLNDGFGAAVALSESAALVGACNDASGARGVGADASRRDAGYAGSASLFAFESGRWKVSTYLKSSNAEALDSFGYGVALSGNLAVVAANWESSKATGVDGNMDDNSAERSGAVYVFR